MHQPTFSSFHTNAFFFVGVSEKPTRECPGNVPDVSRMCPGSVPEVSREAPTETQGTLRACTDCFGPWAAPGEAPERDNRNTREFRWQATDGYQEYTALEAAFHRCFRAWGLSGWWLDARARAVGRSTGRLVGRPAGRSVDR